MGKKIYSLICVEESHLEDFAVFTNYQKAKKRFLEVLKRFRRFLTKEDVAEAVKENAYIEDEFSIQIIEAETE